MEAYDYTLFEKYLSKDLDADAKRAFEEQLQQDANFNAEFETYKELSVHLKHKFENAEARANVETTIKNTGDKYFKTTTSTKTSRTFTPLQFAIAASILVIVGFFTYDWFSVPTYSDYNNFGNINLMVRGSQTEITQLAEDAFNSGQFTEAITYFNDILELTPNNVDVQYYKAIALIETNDYGEADRILRALANGTSVYKYEAVWARALSQLKQEDYSGAIAILETIPQDAGVYDKAQKLLKDLR